MKLIIRNFRKYKDIELEFNQGRTLLSGQSGAGKTTILNAIAWILFGGMKHVEHPEGGKTYGSLQIDNITVVRSKKPNITTLTIGDQVYTGDTIAQPKIDEIFGLKPTWMTTSYISQGNRNYLLTTSNTERFDILKSLLFNENTTIDISKITERIDHTKTTFESQKQSFVFEASLLEREVKSSGLDLTKVTKDFDGTKILMDSKINELALLQVSKPSNDSAYHQIQVLKDELTSIEFELSRIQEDFGLLQYEQEVISARRWNSLGIDETLYYQIKENLDTISRSKERLIYLTNRNKSIRVQELPELEIQQEDIKDLEKYEINIQRLKQLPQLDGSYDMETAIRQQTLRTQLAKFKPSTTNDSTPIEEIKTRIIELQSKDKLRKEQITKFPTYDKQTLEQRISKISNLLDKQELIKVWKKRQEITKFLEEHPVEDNFESKIQELEQQLLACVSLECPHCKGHVVYQDNRLIPIHSSYTSGSIRELRTRKERLEKMRTYAGKVEVAKHELEQLLIVDDMSNLKLLNPSELQMAKQELDKLKTVIWIDDVQPEITRLQRLENDYYYNAITKQIIDYPLPTQIHLIQERKEILEKLKKPKFQVSSSMAKQIYDNNISRKEYHQNQGEISRLLEIKGISCPTEVLREINKVQWVSVSKELINLDFEKIKANKNKHQTLTTKRKEYQLRLQGLRYDETLNQKIFNLAGEIEELKESVRNTQLVNGFKVRKQELKVRQQEINEIGDKLYKMTLLKGHAVSVENDLLTNAINTLNQLLFDNCSRMFEDPINVRLELNKGTRSSISINIVYKGMDYEPSMMSGGELDRISLALTLAFNSISNSPILLLDECLSSLDSKNKENALRCIGDERITIIADHEAIEGHYDLVVNL